MNKWINELFKRPELTIFYVPMIERQIITIHPTQRSGNSQAAQFHLRGLLFIQNISPIVIG